MDYPAAVLEMVQKQVALYGRTGATNIVRVPDLAAAMATATGLVPVEVAAPPLVFQEPGYVVAMYGQTRRGGAADFANVELRLQINGERDLINAGENGPTFFPFLGLFGPSLNWFPLTRRVAKKEIWQLTYRNYDGTNTQIPTVGFAFLSDAQLAKMTAELGS